MVKIEHKGGGGVEEAFVDRKLPYLQVGEANISIHKED